MADTERRYYEMLEAATATQPAQIIKKREWVNMMTQHVVSSNKVLKKKSIKMYMQEALFNYDVIRINSENRLVLKAKRATDEAKVIIPLEDSFQIVLNAHLSTNHGGCSAINQYIANSNQIVALTCAEVMTRVCSKCATKERDGECTTQIEDLAPSSALVDIVDMSLLPDGSSRHLLIYQDLQTKLVQLRPLMLDDMTDEVSMELLKIFSDFSPPVSVVTPRQWKQLLEAVVARLNTLFETVIPLEACDPDEYTVTGDAVNQLNVWTRERAREWSVGCYCVQWDMNNRHGPDDRSPLEKVFGNGHVDSPSDVDSDVSDDEVHRKTETRDKVTPKDGKDKDKGNKHRDKSKNLKSVSRGESVKANSREKSRKSGHGIGKSTDDNDRQHKRHTTPTEECNHIDKIDTTIHESSSGAPIKSKVYDDSLEAPPIIENVKTEQEDEMQSELEMGQEAVTICCSCSEEVPVGERLFCRECKQILHLYCGVTLKGQKDTFEYVCFLCIKA